MTKSRSPLKVRAYGRSQTPHRRNAFFSSSLRVKGDIAASWMRLKSGLLQARWPTIYPDRFLSRFFYARGLTGPDGVFHGHTGKGQIF